MIDGIPGHLQVVPFDGGVDGEVVADPLEPALGTHAPLHGRRPERREVVEVHVGVDGDVGLDVRRPGQRPGEAESRIVERPLERIDGDVERRRHAQDPVHRPERHGAGLASPRAAAGGQRRPYLPDPAGEGDVTDDEGALLRGAEHYRPAVHLQIADDQRLVERLRRLSLGPRPHLEDGLLDLDHAEREGLAPEEARSDDEARAGCGETVGRTLDDEVVDLAGEPPGHDVHAADAAAGAKGSLDPPLDVLPEHVLREVPEQDEDEGDDADEERGLDDRPTAHVHPLRISEVGHGFTGGGRKGAAILRVFTSGGGGRRRTARRGRCARSSTSSAVAASRLSSRGRVYLQLISVRISSPWREGELPRRPARGRGGRGARSAHLDPGLLAS